MISYKRQESTFSLVGSAGRGNCFLDPLLSQLISGVVDEELLEFDKSLMYVAVDPRLSTPLTVERHRNFFDKI